MIEIAVAPGVTLSVAIPEDAREEAEGALPSIDVSAVPGARVTVRRGFADEAMAVRVACVIAPSDRWAPGLEELVLGRATGLAQASVGVAIERWEAGPITTVGARFEQRVTGRSGGREAAAIAHALGFVGRDHEALLCSIACASKGGGSACAGVLDRSTIAGQLEGPPPPSLLVRAVLSAAENPFGAGILFAALSAIAIAALLRTRPRVPGRRSFP